MHKIHQRQATKTVLEKTARTAAMFLIVVILLIAAMLPIVATLLTAAMLPIVATLLTAAMLQTADNTVVNYCMMK